MKWTDELIEQELLKSIKILNLDRMPTGAELKSIGRNDLHCKLGRTKKYSGWAEHLGIPLKRSHTTEGQRYEDLVQKVLETKGYSVESMSTKHPYDLLVNGTVKVDVKASNPYMLRDKNRVHTFALNKENQTCDIYILLVISEKEEIEKCLIIPSHKARMKSLHLGKVSKYDVYDDNWECVEQYVRFFSSI